MFVGSHMSGVGKDGCLRVIESPKPLTPDMSALGFRNRSVPEHSLCVSRPRIQPAKHGHFSIAAVLLRHHSSAFALRLGISLCRLHRTQSHKLHTRFMEISFFRSFYDDSWHLQSCATLWRWNCYFYEALQQTVFVVAQSVIHTVVHYLGVPCSLRAQHIWHPRVSASDSDRTWHQV